MKSKGLGVLSQIVALSFVMSSVFVLGCTHEEPKEQKTAQPVDTRPSGELSLAEDRSALDEQRKDIPNDIKRDNDELALVLQLIHSSDGDEMQDPYRIRDRFDKAIRDRRNKLDKNIQHTRDDYSKKEKQQRDDYFAQLKKEREEFIKSHHTSDERSTFFSDQEQKRRDFISTSQEKRNDFESDLRDKRKNFEDYTREKTNFFNQEFRSYSKRYDDQRKAQSLKKDMKEKERRMEEVKAKEAYTGQGSGQSQTAPTNPTMQKDLQDFDSIPKGPAKNLAPDDQ